MIDDFFLFIFLEEKLKNKNNVLPIPNYLQCSMVIYRLEFAFVIEGEVISAIVKLCSVEDLFAGYDSITSLSAHIHKSVII